MTELLNLLFNPLPNALMTILTGLSLSYWVFTLLAGDGLDLDTSGVIADFDLGYDADADLESPDSDAPQPGIFSKVLDFINVGKVPVMVIITLFKFISWIITIVTSFFLDLTTFGISSILILLPIFLIVYFILHYLTKPLVKLYHNMGYEGDENLELIGRVGVLKSSIIDTKLGLAQVVINKDIISLNVKSKSGEEIPYGSQILVVDESADKKYYYVTKNITLSSI